MFRLPELPYAYDALVPMLSPDTLRLHHDVLHRRYVNTLNAFAPRGTLDEIVRTAKPGELGDSALQTWNHDFLWKSMTPPGQVAIPELSSPLGGAISWWPGGWAGLVRSFKETAKGVFGSGYVWLLTNDVGQLAIWGAQDADNPLRDMPGMTPLLTLDVWEHAYYLDYGAQREDYAEDFLRHFANWDFAQQNFSKALR